MGPDTEAAPKTPLERWFLEGSESCWSPYRARVDTSGRRLDLNTRLETFRRGLNQARTGPWSSNTSPTGSSTDCDEVLHTAVKFESVQFFRKESVKVLEEALPFASADIRSCVVDFDKCPSAHHMPSGYGRLIQPLRLDCTQEAKRGNPDPDFEENGNISEQGPAKRVKTSISEDEIIYLSCPFVKHNGNRYDKINNSCTQRPGFPDTKRLSTHLFRVHCGCLSCRKTFDNTKRLQEHRSKAECKRVEEEEDQPELMTEEQEKIFLKRFDKGTTTTEKYRGWYQVLWPDDPRGATVNPRYDYLVRNPSPVIHSSCTDLVSMQCTQGKRKPAVPSVTMNALPDEEARLYAPVKTLEAGSGTTMAVHDENISAETAAIIEGSATAVDQSQSRIEVGKKLSEKDLSETSLPSLYSSEFMSIFNYSTEDSLSVSNIASPHLSSLVPSNSVDTIGKSRAAVVDTGTQPELLSYDPGHGGNNESEYNSLRCGLDLVVDDDDSEYFYMRS